MFAVERLTEVQRRKKTRPSFLAEGIAMGSKLGSVAIIFGSALILLGLAFVPAALTQKQDQTILGAGICLISFGALCVGAGFYLKARLLESTAAAGSAKQQPKPVRGGCDLCGSESPVIHCRVHQLHICGDCVTHHYDFRSCVYIPSTRRPAPAKPLSKAARAAKA
jgi:hypothetical protein